MRREQLYTILLKAAEISNRTEFVVIGSQALFGSVQDLEITVVLNSADVDFYTVVPIANATWEELMLELGQDSDFHSQHEVYVEVVPSNLARFPPDWESRATRNEIGSYMVRGSLVPVLVTFPEIHDLAVSKLVIGREKDLLFVEEIAAHRLIDRSTLEDRLRFAPKTTTERIEQSLRQVAEIYRHQGITDPR